MVKSVVWGVAAALMMATAPAWADLKIGVVNYTELLQKSPQAQQISARLRSEFEPKQRELAQAQQSLKTRADQYQRDAATMTDDQRTRTQNDLQDSDRDLQRRQSELQDDYNARRTEELSNFQRVLVQQIQSYAKAQNYDLVLVDGVIYANAAIDITPAILTRLEQVAKAGTGATAPRKAKSGH